jgi:hypothetical protein
MFVSKVYNVAVEKVRKTLGEKHYNEDGSLRDSRKQA